MKSGSISLAPALASFNSQSDDETQAYGRRLAAALPRPALLLLLGEPGSGKTVLVKGLAEGMGVAQAEDVTSPSFTLIHEYRRGGETLFHIDLYRLEHLPEISTLGLEDILDPATNPAAVVAIEWGNKFPIFASQARVEVVLSVIDDRTRSIHTRQLAPGLNGATGDTS